MRLLLLCLVAGALFLAAASCVPSLTDNRFTGVYPCTGEGAAGSIIPLVAQCALGSPRQYWLAAAEIPRTGIPLREWTDDGSSFTLVTVGGASATAPLVFVGSAPGDDSVIWSVGQLLEMCNRALASAHATLNGPLNGSLGPDPIRIALDPATRLFTFEIPAPYPGQADLYTRWSVARLFASFGSNNPQAVDYPSDSPREFWFNLSAAAGGRLTQEASSLYAWSDLVEIDIIVETAMYALSPTDYSPLPRYPTRAPYTFTGPAMFFTVSKVPVQVSVYYRFGAASGIARPLMLHEGDFWRLAFATDS